MRLSARRARLVSGALLLAFGSAACSLVVSTDALQAGAEGLGCTADEKVCPDPNAPGRGMCVTLTNPKFGCSSTACGECALPDATARCANDGTCAIASCSGSHFDCNMNPADGCEIDLSRDEQHCGSCLNVCSADKGAPTCSSGACVITFCNAPYADCDHKYSNGCETNTDESAANCGHCNKPCAGTCVAGVCQ